MRTRTVTLVARLLTVACIAMWLGCAVWAAVSFTRFGRPLHLALSFAYAGCALANIASLRNNLRRDRKS